MIAEELQAAIMDDKFTELTKRPTAADVDVEDAVANKEEEVGNHGNESKQLTTKDEIKSSAAVKYSSVETLANFSKLKQDTDLKRPPANWLRSCSKLTWGTSRTNFSSFGMADSCPDTVGEVDVISASENIKTLLKIPFSKAQVNIAVHRIGRTLLLDEFDIYRHLLSAPQSGRNWLRNFIIHQIHDEGKTKFTRKRKTRDDLHSRSLLSKFLYYSIAFDSVDKAEPYTVEEPEGATPQTSADSAESESDPVVMTSEGTSETCHSEFARQVLWHFEDIQMLIGSDLPIFGGGKYPCVSLRLRDENKPINVLTGLDYWLDNLICNVPELAMCYHLNGIVQSYELLKTEEIPQLGGSQFSPGVVKDVAQNVLSFMKSNCTKEGHTYWLFKGNNDDVVKLYDLTSLCSEEETQDATAHSWDNPFSIPVAMLLYKVARNMTKSETSYKHRATISKLLRNCLTLLDKDKHAQIVTSANYMLCDLYISDDPHKEKRDEESSSSDDNTDSGSDGEKDEENSPVSLEVKSLSLPSKHWHWRERENQSSTASGCHGKTIEEKCQEAMMHIVAGLTTLDSDIEANSNMTRNSGQCAIEFPSVNQDDPKPARTNDNPDETVSQGESHRMAVAKRQLSPSSWQGQLKDSLLRKARAVCYIYADVHMKKNEYSEVLRHLHLALLCHSAVSSFTPLHSDAQSKDQGLLSAILRLCGDLHIMLAGDPDSMSKCKLEFLQLTSEEKIIIESVKKEVSFNNFQWALTCGEEVSDCLLTSIGCYEGALDLATGEDDAEYMINTTRRLGNARNELGKQYMTAAVELADSQAQVEVPTTAEQTLWKKSYEQFNRALASFEATSDNVNQALVNCNAGRLMRICAQAYNSGKFSQQERYYFNKAIDHYHTALRQLGDRNMSLRESITWELSTTYFTMATLLQDNAPLTDMAEEQVEKDIKEFMMKALKYCEAEDSSPRQSIVQYRAATVHHRLASMHHNSYRNQINEQKKKHSRTLAELHYGKAVKLFQELDRPSELLRILLERVAMCEHQLNSQTGSGAKIKTLQTALDFLLQSKQSLEGICRDFSESLNEDPVESRGLSAAAKTKANESLEKTETDKHEEENAANLQKTQDTEVVLDSPGRNNSDFKENKINNSGDNARDPNNADDIQDSDKNDKQCITKELEEIENLVSILQSRLQFILFHHVKLHSSKKGDQSKLSKYKKMYAVALSSMKAEGNLAMTLLDTVERITEIWVGS